MGWIFGFARNGLRVGPAGRVFSSGTCLDAAFELISEPDFNSLVAEHCAGLIVKPQLPLKGEGNFLGAVLLYSMKTDFIVSLVAEYEDEFVHFYWETTA